MYVCVYHEGEGEGDGLCGEHGHGEHHPQEVAVVGAADAGVQPLATRHTCTYRQR